MLVMIREFRREDADIVVQLIHADLTEINSRDYPQSVIDYMYHTYTPQKLQELSKKRKILVAEVRNQVVGTASLERDYIGSVFVDPQWHNHGIGTRLMQAIEHLARKRGVCEIHLGASISALEFYKMLGYTQGEESCSKEYGTTFMMTKI